MKQLITLSALAFSLCSLFSCTKDGQSLNAGSATTKQTSPSSGASGDPRFVLPTLPHPDIIGDWQSLNLQNVTTPNGNILYGHYDLKIPLTSDYNNDVKLVFIRISASLSGLQDTSTFPQYRILATDLMAQKYKAHVVGYLQSTSLNVGITAIDPTITPNASDFDNVQYRYFVVTRSTYLNNNIDWTDYNAVVTALNAIP